MDETSPPSADQLMAERIAVEDAVLNYVAGCAAADPETVAEAFSPDAQMWGYLAGEYVTISGAEFVAEVIDGADRPGPEYSHSIHSVEVRGGVATAILDEEQFLGQDFRNYLGLVRLDGRWRIASKIFTSL